VHAVVAVQAADRLAHRRAQRSLERGVLGLDHGDLQSRAAGAARHLGADEAAPHDHERARARQVVAQGARVVQGPQHVHARARELAGQRPRARAGGQHDGVRHDLVAVGQDDGVPTGVEPDGRRPEAPGHVERVVLLAQQVQRGLVHGSGQEALRQRRAVVGQVRLVADDRHPPS
jgi:hypothetical protein